MVNNYSVFVVALHRLLCAYFIQGFFENDGDFDRWLRLQCNCALPALRFLHGNAEVLEKVPEVSVASDDHAILAVALSALELGRTLSISVDGGVLVAVDPEPVLVGEMKNLSVRDWIAVVAF